jgi:hypothetical protein
MVMWKMKHIFTVHGAIFNPRVRLESELAHSAESENLAVFFINRCPTLRAVDFKNGHFKIGKRVRYMSQYGLINWTVTAVTPVLVNISINYPFNILFFSAVNTTTAWRWYVRVATCISMVYSIGQ